MILCTAQTILSISLLQHLKSLRKSSYHLILTDKLKMHRIAANFLPRLLTGAQKENRVKSVRSCLIVPMPPYFPDLAPADFFLFPNLKSSLKGRRFQTVEEIEENSTRDLRAIPQNTFQDAFQNWKKRWERCIKSGGEYCEGD